MDLACFCLFCHNLCCCLGYLNFLFKDEWLVDELHWFWGWTSIIETGGKTCASLALTCQLVRASQCSIDLDFGKVICQHLSIGKACLFWSYRYNCSDQTVCNSVAVFQATKLQIVCCDVQSKWRHLFWAGVCSSIKLSIDC